jgi:hypothetical protein
MDEKDCTQDGKPKVKRQYANARKVLSPELLDALQKEFTGLLWVPNDSQFYVRRRELVLGLKSCPLAASGRSSRMMRRGGGSGRQSQRPKSRASRKIRSRMLDSQGPWQRENPSKLME